MEEKEEEEGEGEGEEVRKQRELAEWRIEEIRKGNVKNNPNLIPLGPRLG